MEGVSWFSLPLSLHPFGDLLRLWSRIWRRSWRRALDRVDDRLYGPAPRVVSLCVSWRRRLSKLVWVFVQLVAVSVGLRLFWSNNAANMSRSNCASKRRTWTKWHFSGGRAVQIHLRTISRKLPNKAGLQNKRNLFCIYQEIVRRSFCAALVPVKCHFGRKKRGSILTKVR